MPGGGTPTPDVARLDKGGLTHMVVVVKGQMTMLMIRI